MTDFFGPKVQRGHCKKAASKAGCPTTKEVPPTAALHARARDQGEIDTTELVQGRLP